jgi:hypothetical protein
MSLKDCAVVSSKYYDMHEKKVEGIRRKENDAYVNSDMKSDQETPL